jgi:hypothetical protein
MIEKVIFDHKSAPSLIYYDWHSKLYFYILGSETYQYYVKIIKKACINRRKYSIDIRDYYRFFSQDMNSSGQSSLFEQSQFIQKYLMPVVKGEMWIDELLKQNKIK